MASQETISRVAKILARAVSDNPNEAEAALVGAYKRMVRDGVTFTDLLTLPVGELYQDTLVRLVEVILRQEPDLSPSARREAYAEYLHRISEKFRGGGASSRSSQDTASDSAAKRAQEAREYEERRRRAEAGRSSQSEEKSSHEKTFKQENVKTPQWHHWTVGEVRFSFSPAAFFLGLNWLFGRGSFFWHCLHAPVHALRLGALSFLYGLAFASIVLTLIAVLTAFIPLYRSWMDLPVRSAFSLLAALGVIIKARSLFLHRWFG